jgi:N-acetyl sugar amidotransferase
MKILFIAAGRPAEDDPVIRAIDLLGQRHEVVKAYWTFDGDLGSVTPAAADAPYKVFDLGASARRGDHHRRIKASLHELLGAAAPGFDAIHLHGADEVLVTACQVLREREVPVVLSWPSPDRGADESWVPAWLGSADSTCYAAMSPGQATRAASLPGIFAERIHVWNNVQPSPAGSSTLERIYSEAAWACGLALEQRPYTQCTRCLLDTLDDARIQFDDSGVCGYCHRYKRLETQRLFLDQDREQELQKILDQVKASKGRSKHDCLLGVSGGVDSTYVAIKLKELGLNPLLVHVDNGWNSELSVMNIQSIMDKLQLDLHTYVIDWEEFRDIQLGFLRASVIDIELVTDHAIVACLYNLAAKLGIKHIISGDNFATEGIMPRGWTHEKSDLLNIRYIAEHFGHRRLRTYPRLGYWRRQYLVLVKGIKVVPLLNYLHYNKAEAKAEITRVLGWKDYGTKHGESIFTRFYQHYILPRKFKADKRKAHLSALICSGQMSRTEALAELDKPLYEERELQTDLAFVTKKLGLTSDEFEAIMSAPVHQHTDYPSYVTKHLKREAELRARWRPVLSFIKRATGFSHRSNYV